MHVHFSECSLTTNTHSRMGKMAKTWHQVHSVAKLCPLCQLSRYLKSFFFLNAPCTYLYNYTVCTHAGWAHGMAVWLNLPWRYVIFLSKFSSSNLKMLSFSSMSRRNWKQDMQITWQTCYMFDKLSITYIFSSVIHQYRSSIYTTIYLLYNNASDQSSIITDFLIL